MAADLVSEMQYGGRPRSLFVFAGISGGVSLTSGVLGVFLGGFFSWLLLGAGALLTGIFMLAAVQNAREGFPHRIILREEGMELPVYEVKGK